MTASQQDEGIYSAPLMQYESNSASGSQLAGTSLTSNDLFVVGFPMEPCDPSEYPNYGWVTGGSGTYEAIPAACQPPSRSESTEGEGYLQRTNHLMTLQPSFTDDCTLPDDVPAFTPRPDLFAQRATSRITDGGRSSSDPNGSLPPSSSVIALGSPHPNGNPSWSSDTWHTFDPEPLAPTYPSTIDPRYTLAAPFTFMSPSSVLPKHPSSKPLEVTLPKVARLETLHEPLLSVPDSQSSVQTSTYASEQEELNAIRSLIKRAPFMTSAPQCPEPNVGSPDDHYTGGRGITGKSIFTAFINVLRSGEYQCIQCNAVYKKLERAIGDQAKHFKFKPYICGEKHDGKTVCGKAFGMKDYRKTHQERENKPSVQCGICPAAIKHARNLPRHMCQVHGHSSPRKRHRPVGKEALYRTMGK